MDAAKFYALLRFEEASLALRAVLRIGLVDQLGDQCFSYDELRKTLGFTDQAARTFFALLQVMDILECDQDAYRVTRRAAECLADGVASSRKPYLSMGSGAEEDALIDLLRGNHPDDAVPLYGGDTTPQTVMDDTEVARAIALGLASRARNFAHPLAAALAARATKAKSLADIGAGSPYVAQACLQTIPTLLTVTLVDRANGMRFAHEIIQSQQMDDGAIAFCEGDFFQTVPAADVYLLSNTAHDWQQREYARIIANIRRVIPEDGIVCIHEPILKTSWDSEADWVHALWMACYALTLLRLTLGEGTCYTEDEHHAILAKCGFQPVSNPVPTSDGCTALFYQPQI